MKKFVFTIAAAIAGLIAAAPAASAQGAYFGAGVSVFRADTPSNDLDLGAFMARAGFELNPMIAVEAEGAIGIKDDDFVVGGTEYDVGIDNQVGGFLVAKAPLGPVKLFGRVGYANFSIDDDSPGTTAPDGSGIAYGGGIEFDLAFLRARADYTRYDVDGSDFDSLGLTALFAF